MTILVGIASAEQHRNHGGSDAMLVSIYRMYTGDMGEEEKENPTQKQKTLGAILEAAIYRAVKESHSHGVIDNVIIKWRGETLELKK